MRNNSKSAMLRMPSLLESRNSLMHFWAFSWKKANPAKFFTHGDWMLSQSRTQSSKKVRPRGARHGKTEAQKEHFVAHNARRRCIKKNFDGIHDRFQKDSTYRVSKLKKWLDRGEVHRDGQIGTGTSSCRCSTTSHGNLKTMNRNANQAPSSFLFMREDFHQEDIPRTWTRKEVIILLMKANQKENGTESQK